MGPPALKIASSRSFCGAGKGTGVHEMARGEKLADRVRGWAERRPARPPTRRWPSETMPCGTCSALGGRRAWLPGEGKLRGGCYGLAELLPRAKSKAQFGFNACEPGGDFLAVGFGGVGVVGVPRFVLAHEARKFFAKKRQKLFRGRGHQEQHPGGNPLSAGFFCGSGEGFEFAFAVGNAWNKGRSQSADGNARIAKFADGTEAQVGTRSAWFEEPREARAQRCDSDVDVKARTPGDFLQHLDIAGNQIRFGGDGDTEAIMACELFEAGA